MNGKCATCGKGFVKASNRQKYCIECGRRGLGQCVTCGKAFKRSGHDSGRYCSRECFWQSVRKPGCRPRPCPVCKTVFKPREERIKTCSRACAAKLQKRTPSTCEVCGISFDSRHRSRTCSYKCAGILRRAPRPQSCARCGVAMPWFKGRWRRYCSAKCRATPEGTRRVDKSGYVFIKAPKGWRSANGAGWMHEHRFVIEQQIGRHLESHERVHHKNGKRDDNREENLELWTVRHKDPAGARVVDWVVDQLLQQAEILAMPTKHRASIRRAAQRISQQGLKL